MPTASSRGPSLIAPKEFERDGFYIIDGFFGDEPRIALAEELSYLFEQRQERGKNKIGGLRNLLQTSARVAEMAAGAGLISILSSIGGKAVFPVRAIFFDKTPAANWSVPWHQDLAICVRERIETPGTCGWVGEGR